MEDEADIREQLFHNTVRENIIFFLLFLVLYVSSYALIAKFRRRDREDYFSVDEDEATVYKISLWLCTVALAVSVGATLLLPVSIASNEVLILYPNSYYVKWLNSSLIQGLWNLVFLFSNLSLFVFLPFAYLFTESEGFVGYKKGVMARVYETVTVLCLLGTLVLGMTYVLSALIDRKKSSLHTLLNLSSYYLPFLYSCVSFVGVVMLLLCTPMGFVRLFGVVGSFLVKPQFLKNLDEEFFAYRLEEDCIRRRLQHAKATGKSYVSPVPMSIPTCGLVLEDDEFLNVNPSLMCLRNGALQRGLAQRLEDIQKHRSILDQQRRTWWVRRTLLYPLAMLALLILSTATALLAVQNTLELLIGIKALPLSTRQFTLGISSLSKLGPIGATIEVAVILYLAATSAIGLYTLPGVKSFRPRLHSMPLTHLIANCGLLLVLSSALPLLSRILGMTNFDLLGDFGRIEWLGNFELVLFYNLIFATAAIGCLVTKFTATVRKEIYARLRSSLIGIFKSEGKKSSLGTFSTKED
ncbi:protein Lilipod [Bombus vosnesenskii]|uniref:Protein Lilipod n=2 Tax=Pyrobombus TaxID=144703 RepID=A0A6J3K641_9HYME|nr:protein Lilipod [Bombus vancouverensis nearcticus]XP_033317776.1 protein Lilipod [Bombus bifarius]XP_033348110.1 protein Lilipod [Bombus vosnesenskii]XP_050491574.1 protein Lilipod isoform X1 [Bombus huntii]